MKKRPTYKIWDKKKNKFFEPTYCFFEGNLKEITLMPSGDLTMRRIKNGKEEHIHESCFPDRYEVIFDEQESNQSNTINFQGTINYEIKN